MTGRKQSNPKFSDRIAERGLEYWRGRLAGLESVGLPSDRLRPQARSATVDAVRFQVPAEVAHGLRALAARRGASLLMVTLAAFQAVLTRWTGSDDVAVLSPVAVRGRTGIVANLVVLRADLSGSPRFVTLLDQVKALILDAYTHKDLPFERVLAELAPEHDRAAANPLSAIVFALQGVGTTLLPDAVAAVDCSVTLTEDQQGGLSGDVVFAKELFDTATIERLVGHFEAALRGVMTLPGARVGDLDLLSAQEKEQLAEFNATEAAPAADELTVHELVQARAVSTPDAIAVAYGTREVTYRELNERAIRLARCLQARGVGREDLIAVCLDRGPDLIVALLGILKVGAAYLPLDAAYPEQRLRFMLEDTGAPLLVTQLRLRDRLDGLDMPQLLIDQDWSEIAAHGAEDLTEAPARPESLAYVIFTSGSTGTPKGVMVEHHSLRNFAAQLPKRLRIGPNSRVLQFTSPSFDVSLAEIFGTLLAGATLLVADARDLAPGKALEDTIVGQRASVVIITPSVLSALKPDALADVRTLVVGGEPCSPDVIASWAQGRHLVNAYGPTETSIGVVFHRFTPEEKRVLIGRPIGNTTAYVVDRFGGLAPLGVPGELWIGGPGVARGYWNRPELTQERFVPDRFAGQGRLYRSGDLVRWLPGGELEFLGRIDQQVKIRGLRIELGEIENALAAVPGVGSAVVVVREDTPGDKRLVGYCTAVPGGTVDAVQVRAACRERLPEYMVPALVVLDALPLTPNGKVDRGALPPPQSTRPEADDSFTAPRTEVESVIAEVWCEVLGVERVGVFDDFFALGGHSLLATRVVNKVDQLTGLQISLKEFLLAPTVAALAEHVVETFAREDADTPVA